MTKEKKQEILDEKNQLIKHKEDVLADPFMDELDKYTIVIGLLPKIEQKSALLDRPAKLVKEKRECIEKQQEELLRLKKETLDNLFMDDFFKYLRVFVLQHEIEVNEIKLTK